MASNFYGFFFRMCRWMIRRIYPSYEINIQEDLKEPVVYIAHHQNLFGPFIILLWYPKNLRPWILHVFLNWKECYKQYVDYTFTKRFGYPKIIAQIIAFPISLVISQLMKSGKGIPVYRGSKKILTTFKHSVEALEKGEDIVIFPDVDYTDSSSKVKELYEGYLYIEKFYYKKTGKHVHFVPLYVSKKKRIIIADESITFSEHEDFSIGQKRIGTYIKQRLNELARHCEDFN